MKQKLFMASIGLLLVTLLTVNLPIFAVKGPWTYLATEDYQMSDSVDGTPLLFSGLQDADKEKIKNAVTGTMTPEGVEVSGANDPNTWKGQRPEIIDPVKFKKLSADSTLAETAFDTFEIPYEDIDGSKTAKIARTTLGSKKVLTAADPEFSNFKLIASPNNKKYVLPSEKGLWSVDPDKGSAVKISKDQFNGKGYSELAAAHRELFAQIDGPAILWWNENPIFSPDGNSVVYMTNRDCIESLGNSIWLYDFNTGEEKPLIQNADGEQYYCIGWLDNTHLLYKQFTNNTVQYFVSDLSGNRTALSLQGAAPAVLAIQSTGLIAYTSDYTVSRDICIGKVDTSTGLVTKQYEKSIEGTLRDPHTFSPDGTKFAYLYAPDENNTLQSLAIIDLTMNSEEIVKELPANVRSRHIMSSFDWFDSSKLLVRLSKVEKGMHQTSTWIYDMEGGRGNE